MHMTFEKIDPQEHPAARAAKMIKDLHQQTIARIDAGSVFLKNGVDVNYEVRDACLKQIDLCDGIIARANSMPPSLAGEAFMILKDLEDVVASKKPMKVVPDEKEVFEINPFANEPPIALPEIGNYDHKKTE